ncbi:amino acid ABC transporter ATP-binding protein [Slackia heliotrinireducens]|uniref:ABC-type polar-amino-acid transporter n=1 Tax=Slackia heliotrinireducens (strain ATCC 29202 / DSM 20476 / NCTC 11029 / RHS 1) TaxID=471855 RepID=C7N4B4_SLAHD|nr:amino acid ABC transporter ATP-binding protein [Slackia heliotrinireducens]ACV21749.1 amino acid ABC transporter ATP-binding protein [Slackia heliotrinireducens DSM 20476]VEG99396.1 L-cystine import ATP-binding protein TcyC [Slackia heliotrinireducens]
MSDRECIFSLQNIEKSFGSNTVLKDISLSVYQGDVVSIIGSSGGGKSTLLRCATLLERFEKGSLTYGDLPVATADAQGNAVYGDKKTLQQARQRFGLVFQNFNLFPHRTVLQNVMDAPVRVAKMDKDQARDKAMGLIERMGLSGKEDMVPCELSGGQQQRVSIARALCLDPDVVFFDEPTSALDPELTREVLKVIKSLAAEHRTMVIVTHEIGFARDVADRVVFMDGGLIVEDGTPDQVINNPQHERTRRFLMQATD